MINNPFSLDFGAEPNLYIPRLDEQAKIINTFKADMPSTHIYLITGVRGSGKTVLMTSVSHTLKELPKWIHIDLNVESDILNSLAANIYKRTTGRFPKIKFEANISPIGVSLESANKYQDIQSDIDSMLDTLNKHDIKLLLTLDEVVNSKNVREFTSYFQHCLREKLPVYLLMTGLYKNIRALQNNRSQTFLKRAQKINIGPLNMRRIAREYENIFETTEADALKLAQYTAGYSYGFQILGYHLFEHKKKTPDKDVLFDYQTSLEESSYEKIWEELSEMEKRVASVIASHENNIDVKSVRDRLDMDSNNFSTYQNTLENMGILSTDSSHGRLNFCLPYFREFVLRQNY